MTSTKQLLLLAAATLVTCHSSCSAATTVPRGPLLNTASKTNININTNINTPLLLTTRGGKTSPSKKKKKKKKSGTAKQVIDHAMKEKDSAQALGDAIRDRADVLRQEDPLLQSIDWSIHSVSHGLGASDSRMQDGGGVQAATTSIIANYFLKSHGGAHALQVACSLLATISGLLAVFLPSNQPLGFTCLQRCLLFALVKHVSGLLAAAAIAAKAIPKIGLSQTRGWMEQLVLDPVSQYVSYTALILLWLPSPTRLVYAWWSNYSWVAPLLVGPILVREVISNLLVVSDILVLSNMNNNGEGGTIQTILNISQSTINAFMSLLVSPQTWRAADPAKRQAILAKLVSKVSLVMEVAVGLLLSLDFGFACFQMAFTGGPKRPPLKEIVARLLCVRLYVHFLWVRRKRISKVGLQVRGGATQLPFWIMDVVLEPSASMGLPSFTKKQPTDDGSSSSITWKDYVSVAFGMDHQ